MKLIHSLFVAVVCVLSTVAYPDQMAKARLWCSSVRFQTGQSRNGDVLLDLTSLDFHGTELT